MTRLNFAAFVQVGFCSIKGCMSGSAELSPHPRGRGKVLVARDLLALFQRFPFQLQAFDPVEQGVGMQVGCGKDFHFCDQAFTDLVVGPVMPVA